MGNKTIKQEKINMADWEEVEVFEASGKSLSKSCRVLRHLQTSQQIQEYCVHMYDQNELSRHYDAFTWRQVEDYVVRTHYFLNDRNVEPTPSDTNIKILTQRIPLRLTEINNLPSPDYLYMLKCCIEGFQKLYQKYGFMNIEENMICINNDSKVKVWLSENLSEVNFYAQKENNGYQEEQEMVRKIIQIVSKNTRKKDEGLVPIKAYFEKYIPKPTFDEARLLLYRYIKEFRIYVPESLNCVKQLIQSKKAMNAYEISGSYRNTKQDMAKLSLKYLRSENGKNDFSFLNNLQKDIAGIDEKKISMLKQKHAQAPAVQRYDNNINLAEMGSKSLLGNSNNYNRFGQKSSGNSGNNYPQATFVNQNYNNMNYEENSSLRNGYSQQVSAYASEQNTSKQSRHTNSTGLTSVHSSKPQQQQQQVYNVGSPQKRQPIASTNNKPAFEDMVIKGNFSLNQKLLKKRL